MKKKTPRLFYITEERKRFYQPKWIFVQENHGVVNFAKPYKIGTKEKVVGAPLSRRISKDKMLAQANGKAYNSTITPGRKAHIIVRWHPDLQIYEFVHATTNKRRAFTYIKDTFADMIRAIGKEEVYKIYKVIDVVCW